MSKYFWDTCISDSAFGVGECVWDPVLLCKSVGCVCVCVYDVWLGDNPQPEVVRSDSAGFLLKTFSDSLLHKGNIQILYPTPLGPVPDLPQTFLFYTHLHSMPQ